MKPLLILLNMFGKDIQKKLTETLLESKTFHKFVHESMHMAHKVVNNNQNVKKAAETLNENKDFVKVAKKILDITRKFKK